MPVRGEIMQVEDEAERVGVLWRSQGETFIAEQAAELAADVERLRAAYTKSHEAAAAAAATTTKSKKRSQASPPPTIDLRDGQKPPARVGVDAQEVSDLVRSAKRWNDKTDG